MKNLDLLIKNANFFSTAAIKSLNVVAKAAEKAKNETVFALPADHSKVKDEKGHFPINSMAQAKSAVTKAKALKKVPSWWKGSVEDLVSAVTKSVKKHYKTVDLGDKK